MRCDCALRRKSRDNRITHLCRRHLVHIRGKNILCAMTPVQHRRYCCFYGICRRTLIEGVAQHHCRRQYRRQRISFTLTGNIRCRAMTGLIHTATIFIQ